MAGNPPPVVPRSPLLKLDPPEFLLFRAPFDERKVCLLTLTNPTLRRVGFKMRCTAAECYAANPASGIVEPNGRNTISVYLWEQKGKDLTKLDWKRHRFGVTYLTVANDCTIEQIDDIIRRSSKDVLKTAILKSLILNEEESEDEARDMVGNAAPRLRLHTISSVKSGENVSSNYQQQEIEEQIKALKTALVTKTTELTMLADERNDLQKKVTLNESIITEMEKEKLKLEKDLKLWKERAEEKLKLEGDLKLWKERLEQQEKENEFAMTRNKMRINELEVENVQLKQERQSAVLFMKEKEEAHRKEILASQDISFWEVSYKDITITGTELGRGAFATVNVGYFHEQKVAVKMLHPNILSDHYIELLRREVGLMAKVRHPHLLLFMAVVFDHPTECPLIITELMTMSLRNALYKPPTKLDNRAKLRIMNDVASALHYLHTQREPILHRDVSSANVLLEELSKTWRGKLSDFGAANLARFSISAAPGAEIYTAPEIPRASVLIEENVTEQTPKVDVYSYGILLCEVFTDKPQLPTRDSYGIMLKAIEVNWSLMHQLILSCVQVEPHKRPTMKQILQTFRDTFSRVLS